MFVHAKALYTEFSAMQPVALGIRTHSGWGALVAVCLNPVKVVERQRIAITEPDHAGDKQPYHFAKGQSLPKAERYLAECAAISEQLAFAALGATIENLKNHGYVGVGCAILQASGRPLPGLPQILASHSLIHTAEGEFFRNAFGKAAERLNIRVTGIRERDLAERATAVFGSTAVALQREMVALGKSVGPPWTSDQKTASLAALIILAPTSEAYSFERRPPV
jgi:hypothetical protein